MNGYPEVRLRRLRRTAAIRDMFGMDAPSPAKFIWPVFVVPGSGRREAIASMPGQFRLSADELVRPDLPVSEVLSSMSALELAGAIEAGAGGYYLRRGSDDLGADGVGE